jgi:hypothetical protein
MFNSDRVLCVQVLCEYMLRHSYLLMFECHAALCLFVLQFKFLLISHHSSAQYVLPKVKEILLWYIIYHIVYVFVGMLVVSHFFAPYTKIIFMLY